MDPLNFYLRETGSWRDPNPYPVLEKIKGPNFDAYVIRDDLLKYGSKIRGIDYLIGHYPLYKDKKEVVFGSCPATGFAQVSLPYVCNRYGKKAILFMAKRNMENLHPFQKLALETGADIRWVENGMLTVTQKRAKDYVAENPDERILLPIGLEHPTVVGSFIKVAHTLQQPGTFWTVGSSGTLNRSLQIAWPMAEAHVVSVGHAMSEREIGRAIFHRSPYKFDKPVKAIDAPPYPSAAEYDSKIWRPMCDWYEKNEPKGPIYIWNVA